MSQDSVADHLHDAADAVSEAQDWLRRGDREQVWAAIEEARGLLGSAIHALETEYEDEVVAPTGSEGSR